MIFKNCRKCYRKNGGKYLQNKMAGSATEKMAGNAQKKWQETPTEKDGGKYLQKK
jgi:hypothetical protein